MSPALPTLSRDGLKQVQKCLQTKIPRIHFNSWLFAGEKWCENNFSLETEPRRVSSHIVSVTFYNLNLVLIYMADWPGHPSQLGMHGIARLRILFFSNTCQKSRKKNVWKKENSNKITYRGFESQHPPFPSPSITSAIDSAITQFHALSSIYSIFKYSSSIQLDDFHFKLLITFK